MHANSLIGTKVQRLSLDLRKAVQYQLCYLANGNSFDGLIATSDFKLLPSSANSSPSFQDVNDLAIVIFGKQPNWLPLTIVG